MVVNRDESPEYAVINDMQDRKPSAQMMLFVFQQDLCRLKLFYRNDCFMLVRIEVLITILTVSFLFVLKNISSKGFPCQNAAAVAFIS